MKYFDAYEILTLKIYEKYSQALSIVPIRNDLTVHN